MTTILTQPVLITAEQFALLPDDDTITELVRGKIVRMNPPYPYHGYVCSKISRILGNFVDTADLGRVLTNDSGVITERDPDTVRGADIAFYRFDKIPRGPFPVDAYLTVVPDLIVEVRSPSDRWSNVLEKVTEYLKAGVVAVIVVDPKSLSVQVHRDSDQMPQTLRDNDELTLPDLLPGFSVPVKRLFE
jgi:Uma2 family endonuclease